MAETVKLTIDGREVEAPAGATILDAAGELGIRIPTLCHLKGAEPVNSCFVCVVEVEGRESLSPACSTRAVEGMVVRSDCEDVHAARRAAFELLLSEHTGDCEGPCTPACPAGLDIPGMIDHVTVGRLPEAVAVARERILFNAVLGRICPAFCERACRRAQLDEPIAVAALQRFVGDSGLPDRKRSAAKSPDPAAKKVAVVGAGPAGLTAAYYLLLRGHACTVFDAKSRPGGMLRYAIPVFRLPRAALDGEIDVIRRLGAEFRMTTPLGGKVSLDELRADFDAVLLATGAPVSSAPEFEGSEFARSAMDFLAEANAGKRPHVGKEVIVMGATDAALDSARAALRLGAEEVAVLWEGTRAQMPCRDEIIDAAEAEGVRVRCSVTVPSTRQLPNGRRRVVVDDGESLLPSEVDVVIMAGERAADTALAAELGLEVTAKGIAADARTGATNIEGVFAAGECVRGPGYAVHAVAAARRATLAIDQYLTGQNPTGEAGLINVRMGKPGEEELAVLRGTADPAGRTPTELIDLAGRTTTFDEVVKGLSEGAAAAEARRCVRCACAAKDDCGLRRQATEYGARAARFKGDGRKFARELTHPDVVYESGKCILCGLCIRVARENGEALGLSFLGRGFATTVGVPFEEALSRGLEVAAGECVAVCPTGALAFKPGHEPSPSRD